DYVEEVACQVDDLGYDVTMKECKLGEHGKCLVVRHEDGSITAIGNRCSHYGAPLVSGSLRNGVIICPWHGACFNASTGDIEDFPGLDSVHKFQVTIHKNDVIVRAKREFLNDNKRNDLIGRECRGNNTHFDRDVRIVIVGGGPSSLTCAETLRHNGFYGDVIILSRDVHLPYDRPKLSKNLDVDAEGISLRPPGYYADIGVRVHTNAEVIGVDVVQKKVRLANQINGLGAEVTYDKLVLATGGIPKRLEPTLGWKLRNIFVLRTPEDAKLIREASVGKRVVVVGSSFIAMEVTSYLATQKLTSSISVICGRRSMVPFEQTLGKRVGEAIMTLHQNEGSVRFFPGVGVCKILGDDVVKQVVTSDGQTMDADVVVLGVGVVPATRFLRDSEIRLTERGFIQVDTRMRTKTPHVYAVGDIAMFPMNGGLVNIQHWQMAHAHGRVAALDIIQSLALKIDTVPFFWTVQFGRSLRFAGHANGYNDVIVRGSLDDYKFAAYYVRNDVVVAVATMTSDPIAAEFAQRLKAGEAMRRCDI
uniref:Rieske domain-containing protein n=1 Tax=Ciona savignyi TaxID=51511 RepID=H2Y453_CIOSA